MSEQKTATTADRSFIAFPNDSVDEVLNDGSICWAKTGLYQRLIDAGYPIHRDDSATFDRIVDVRTDGTKVTVYAGLDERVMDADLAEVFLAWYRRNAKKEEGETDG